MNLRDLPRIARTLRPLRASQLVWRGRYALERRLPAACRRTPSTLSRVDLLHLVARAMPDIPVPRHPGATGTEAVERLARGEFVHLNRAANLGPPGEVDWQLGPRSEHRLWIITLHYHAWAFELARTWRTLPASADQRNAASIPPTLAASDTAASDTVTASVLFERLIDDWIARCDVAQPGARDLAWNSFAIGTRIGWWVRSHAALGSDWWTARPAFHARFLDCLWRQAEFLHGHPEWDLRGNHVLRNAVGLAWAGRFFTGERPRRWLDAATAIAVDQANEQVLLDGGHFERSPMYHVHVMEDFLALGKLLSDREARQRMRQTWESMADCLAWMRHPDGDVPLFNDAALAAVSTPAEMFAAGKKAGYVANDEPRRGGRFFDSVGMCVWHGDPWTVFFDVGDVGPDCQPGHAHADTLSLECSYRGRRLFVDPGTHSYDHDAVRRYDRATASHNTVCIDGRDSSEVWHVFRVGRRARPIDVSGTSRPDRLTASAAHTGYDRLPGRPRHHRDLDVRNDGPLIVTDRIGGEGIHELTAGWLLAPGWTATPASGSWSIEGHGERLNVSVAGPPELSLSIESAVYHPEYGREITTQRLIWRYAGPMPVEVTTRVDAAQGRVLI